MTRYWMVLLLILTLLNNSAMAMQCVACPATTAVSSLHANPQPPSIDCEQHTLPDHTSAHTTSTCIQHCAFCSGLVSIHIELVLPASTSHLITYQELLLLALRLDTLLHPPQAV